MILNNNGELVVFGANFYGQLGEYKQLYIREPYLLMINHEIKEIIYGGYHTIIIMKNNEIFTFGNNSYGQLGLKHRYPNENQHRFCPTSATWEKKSLMIILEKIKLIS